MWLDVTGCDLVPLVPSGGTSFSFGSSGLLGLMGHSLSFKGISAHFIWTLGSEALMSHFLRTRSLIFGLQSLFFTDVCCDSWTVGMCLHISLTNRCPPPPELLSQLSGVRRSAGGQLNSPGPSASQLQQLQMQLQLERQQAQAARQQLESARSATRRGNPGNAVTQPNGSPNPAPPPPPPPDSSPPTLHSSQFLLARSAGRIFTFENLNVKEFLI